MAATFTDELKKEKKPLQQGFAQRNVWTHKHSLGAKDVMVNGFLFMVTIRHLAALPTLIQLGCTN